MRRLPEMVGAARITGLAAGLLLAGSLAACGAAAAAPAGSSGSGETITLYHGQHEETTQALVSAFEKQTGIKVTVRSNAEAVVTGQILQEGARSPADVIYTENSPPLEKLAEHRLLAPANASALATVPARYDSPAGDWVAVSARVTVLAYNTRE